MSTASDSSVSLRVIAELTTGYGARLAFAPDGEHWVAASAGGASLWRGRALRAVIAAPSATTDRVRFSRDGARVLLAPYAYDVAREAWSERGLLGPRLAAPGGAPLDVALYAAAWDADGDALAVSAGLGSPDQRALGELAPRVVIVGGAQVTTVRDGGDQQRAIAIDDCFVAMAGRDIAVWSRGERRIVATLRGHAVPVHELVFSADGGWLASIDGQGALRIWDTASWTAHATIQTSPQAGLAVAIHPTRPIVATGGHDGELRLWAIDRGALIARHALGGWVQGVAFSPDGTRVLAAANALPARITLFALEN